MTRCVPEKPRSSKSFSEFPRPYSETRFRYSWANVLSIRERLRRGTIQARFASTSPPSTCCSRMGACESANELVLFFTCMPKELSALPSAWKSTNDDDGYMLCVVVVAPLPWSHGPVGYNSDAYLFVCTCVSQGRQHRVIAQATT